MKKWQEFLEISSSLSPNQMKVEIETLLKIKTTDDLYDSITDELHFNFEFEGYQFSFHNPYGGGYGYWFFYKIRRNNPKVTQKLENLLQNHFEA